MILIENILMDESIIREHFACNVHACKGSCCTLTGGEGAPLKFDEIAQIQESIPHVVGYLNEQSKNLLIADQWVGGSGDNMFVECIDDADCVFVFREEGIAKCALEKAFHEGKISFQKPLSCHLFPIRIRNFGGDYLSYQPFEECEPAKDYGKQQGTFVIESVKSALIRAFGEKWYDKAKQETIQEDS